MLHPPHRPSRRRPNWQCARRPPRHPQTEAAHRPPPDVEQPTFYALVQGEALEHVALRHGITIEELAAVNGIVNLDRVRVGQLLLIP